MDPLNLKSKFGDLKLEETSVLDLGCGVYGSPLSSQMKTLPLQRLISIDAHKPAIDQLHNAIHHSPFATKMHICRNREATAHASFAQEDAYDVVLIMDLLEHVSKEDALELLERCKIIAKKKILIWIPLGDCPQGDIAGNPFQRHQSTWSAKDLEKVGFHVEVFPGFHTQFDPPVDAAWAFWDKEEDDLIFKGKYKDLANKKPAKKSMRLQTKKVKLPSPALGEIPGPTTASNENLDYASIKKILVDRLDVHGDVLVATSILPGLWEKYPDAKIDWHVRRGYDFALKNNVYINEIIQGPAKDYRRGYDLVVAPDHHMAWSGPMAMVHCKQADVSFNPPELYFTKEELEAIPEKHKNRILVANAAGWNSRVCPNLPKVLAEMTEHHPEMLQVDNGRPIADGIDHFPKLSLREVAARMSYAKLYIGIDTVFMHMAVALGVPMVLCMGPTDQKTQYIPNATVIKPYTWDNPAEPYPDTKDGIQIPQTTILLGIRTKLAENGEIIDKKPRRKMISYSKKEDYIV
ncbi:MAG: glycosyltransferase family 9 protein [Candidatus Thorarchaeota archaeon]